MTSAPVKSADSLVNPVGAGNRVQTARAGTEQDFGSAMDKASGENRNVTNDHQVTAAKRSEAAKHTGVSEGTKGSHKVSDVKETQSTASLEEQTQAVKDACRQMKEALAEAFGVSEEDVEQAMETLGLSMVSLLTPANLSELVLVLGGETDASALLTNESLFGKLRSLNELAGELRQELMSMMNFSEEELDASLTDTQDFMETAAWDGMPEQNKEPADGQKADSQEQPEITIEIRQNGKTVELTADQNGNATGDGQVVAKEEASHTDTQEQSGGKRDGEEQAQTSLHSENITPNALTQDKVPAVDADFTQSITSFTSDTQEIMDQILDNLRIRLTPGMDSLQMQLHPESLGTVHVQITSKAGEVTAQFHVQNEAVKAAVESQIAALKENLSMQGVKVDAVEVSVDTRGFESSLWQGGENPGQEAYEKQRRSPRRINLAQLDPSFEEEASEEDLLAAKLMEANGNTVDYTA